MRYSQAPHLGEHLPYFGRDIWKFDHLLKTLPTNLFHRWFIVGGNQCVCGGADLLLSSADGR